MAEIKHRLCIGGQHHGRFIAIPNSLSDVELFCKRASSEGTFCIRAYVEKWLTIPLLISTELSEENALAYVNDRISGQGRWLPIGDEPKDDTWFLACWAPSQSVRIVRSEFSPKFVYDKDGRMCDKPTHWMPLPAPVRENDDAKNPTV